MFDRSVALAVAVAALGTSFLSGVFGMVGGLVLMGILLIFLPVPAAMTLHAVTQMTANGWRAAVWHKSILWRVMPGYLLGSALGLAVLALVQFSPPKPWVYLCLGLMLFVVRLLPRAHAPEIRRRGAPMFVGAMVMCLHVLAGVSRPVLDMFYLAGIPCRLRRLAGEAGAAPLQQRCVPDLVAASGAGGRRRLSGARRRQLRARDCVSAAMTNRASRPILGLRVEIENRVRACESGKRGG